MKNFFVVVFVVICCSVLLYADLSISPAVINVVATDDAFCESTYSVFNAADSEAVVKVYVEDWKNCSQNSSDVTASKWLILPKAEFKIKPKATVEVPFRIETFNGMVGSVSAMVVFSSNKSGMINMTMKVPVYIIIEGTEIVDFKIDSLKISESQTGNIVVSFTIKNNGNVHIRHTCGVKVYDTETGDVVKKIEMDESFPTYCESSRDFSVNVATKDELKKGSYVAVFEVRALGRFVNKSVWFDVLKDGKVKVKNNFWDIEKVSNEKK